MSLPRIDMKTLDRVKGVIIGPSGRGKTSLAKTLKGKTLIVAVEPGLLCLRDEILAGKIEAVQVNSVADLMEVYKEVKSSGEFQNVFLDSMTELSDMVQSEIEERTSDSWAAYREIGKQLISITKAFRDLPNMNVFFTCLDMIELDAANRRTIGPAVAGKMFKNKFTSLFDLVLYYDMHEDLVKGTSRRQLVADNFNQYPGKDRSGKLGTIVRPDLQWIINKITGAKEEDQPTSSEE